MKIIDFINHDFFDVQVQSAGEVLQAGLSLEMIGNFHSSDKEPTNPSLVLCQRPCARFNESVSEASIAIPCILSSIPFASQTGAAIDRGARPAVI